MDTGDITCSALDADDGPECGTAEARVWLRVTYAKAGRVAWLEERYCCARHIPDLSEALGVGEAMLSLAISDSLTMTVIDADGNIQTFLNGCDLPEVDFSQPPGWPTDSPSILVSFSDAA